MDTLSRWHRRHCILYLGKARHLGTGSLVPRSWLNSKHNSIFLCWQKSVRLFRASPSDGYRGTYVLGFHWRETRRCLGPVPGCTLGLMRLAVLYWLYLLFCGLFPLAGSTLLLCGLFLPHCYLCGPEAEARTPSPLRTHNHPVNDLCHLSSGPPFPAALRGSLG